MKKVVVTKDEQEKWLAFDRSFRDAPHEYENFRDLKNDPEPLALGWGETREFVMVGNGSVTDENKCGSFIGVDGCLDVEKHNHVDLDGVDHSGHMYGKKSFQ